MVANILKAVFSSSNPPDPLAPDAILPPGDAPQMFAQRPPRPPPDPPWSIWDVVRIALVALLAILLFSYVALEVAHAISGKALNADEVARDPRIIVPAQGAAYLAVVLFMYLLVTRGYDRPFLRGVHWRFPARTWPAFAAGGAVLAVAVQLASSLLPVPKQLPIDDYFRNPSGAWMMAVFGTLVAPTVEELFFRGFLYPVARRAGLIFGLVSTALLFALIHEAQLAHAWAPLLMLFVVGLALTITRERTDSVASGVLVHMGYNGALFVFVWVASDHFRHLERLSQ